MSRWPRNHIPRIDWSNPLTRGLVSCVTVVGGRIVDLANPARSFTNAGKSAGRGLKGRHVQATMSGGEHLIPSPAIPTGSGNWTYHVLSRFPANAGNASMVAANPSGAYWSFGYVSSGELVVWSGSGSGFSPSLIPPSSGWAVLLVSGNAAANQMRGIMGNGAVSTLAKTIAQDMTSLLGDSSTSSRGWPDTALMLVYNRTQSDDEMRRLQRDIWQIFEPVRRSVPLVAVTAASASTGSAAGTGAASAVGVATASASGAASALAAASATGTAIKVGAASAIATGSGSGVGTSVAAAAGASSAVSSAAATGTKLASGAGTSAATGTASGAGTVTALATGSAAATSAASGAGLTPGSIGASASTSSADAVGRSTATVTAISAAVSAGAAGGQSTATAAGSASASSAASATGSVGGAQGQSSAQSTAAAVGTSYATGVAMSAGFGVAVGAGQSIAQAAGVSTATSTAEAAAGGIDLTVRADRMIAGFHRGRTITGFDRARIIGAA